MQRIHNNYPCLYVCVHTQCDLVLVTVGTDRDGGQFLLAGREEAVVSTLGPK